MQRFLHQQSQFLSEKLPGLPFFLLSLQQNSLITYEKIELERQIVARGILGNASGCTDFCIVLFSP